MRESMHTGCHRKKGTTRVQSKKRQALFTITSTITASLLPVSHHVLLFSFILISYEFQSYTLQMERYEGTKTKFNVHALFQLFHRCPFNAKTMQQMMVQYAFDHMGSDIFSVMEKGKHTCLSAVLRSAKKEILPAISTSTTRRWIKHYLFFGETAQETKDYRNKVWGTSRCKRNFSWTTDDITCLKNIIDDKPYLFLDEIQEKFYETTGKHYSTSTIWRLPSLILILVHIPFMFAFVVLEK